MEIRICTYCRKEKPLETGFYRDKNRSKGRSYCCIDCYKIKRKEYEKTEKYKIAVRKSNIKKNYGIDYRIIPDKCQICNSNKRICVDHDHKTGRIRGFICTCCNNVLGNARDNPDILRRLIIYLEGE